MIRRDHNRANVIIWSIANETPHSAERDAFLGKLRCTEDAVGDSLRQTRHRQRVWRWGQVWSVTRASAKKLGMS